MKNKLLTITLASGMLLSSCQQATTYKSVDEYPVYSGNDLGVVYTPSKSVFKTWSPAAQEVVLSIYEMGEGGEPIATYEMKRGNEGSWKKSVHDDLKGKFYTFKAKINDKWLDETQGIWATAVGVNGNRAAIIDFNATNPEGWDNDPRPELKDFTDVVLYEVHMRDFSVAPNSGMKNKGKFLAFTEEGTTSPEGEKTGIDHLVELGITHVHLLPSYDYGSIDESRLSDNKYNWGYDPKNYNVPEGGYSTDPFTPEVRIKEFKQMVQALHKHGIRVVMDVVYNHTYIGDGSMFQLTAPGYFYRFNPDGSWGNASGCGNETASEREMMRNFMVESVKYWVNEYHIDGFRFDLMGIHDITTMNAIREALDQIDPSIITYGEGWTAGDSPLPYEQRAIKAHAKQFNIAVFSDDIRDALKGSWANSKVGGFIAGVEGNEESVKFGIVGATKHDQVDYSKVNYSKEPYANNPTSVINYVSCHDDLCLNDKIKEAAPKRLTSAEALRFNKLAQTVVFTSQGIPFIYAGEELYRNKKGIHNTYQSPDSINQIDWSNKAKYKEVFNYYQGLIALRKAHPAFRMATTEEVQNNLKFFSVWEPNLVAYSLNNNANGDPCKTIIVILNGNRSKITFKLPEGSYTAVCHDGQINLSGIKKGMQKQVDVMPSSATILLAE